MQKFTLAPIKQLPKPVTTSLLGSTSLELHYKSSYSKL